MKMRSKVGWMGMAGWMILLAAPAAHASDGSAGQSFRFKFELNHPLIFSADAATQTLTDRTMQLDTGNKSTLTKNSVETRYKLKLTPVKQAKDGTWTLHYEPYDFEEDMNMTANDGHLTTSIRGLEVKSTQNGILVVDSAKGVGIAQAKSLKQAVYAKMLSGYFEFTPAGVIAKVDGDLPFIDFWNESIKYQVGFFDLVFPAGPVPPGGSWTTNMAVKDLEGIKLGDDGITETNVFARGDTASTNQLVPFTITVAVNERNLMGSMDALGQNTMLNITEFNHNKSGTLLFDPAAGCLTTGTEDESIKLAMGMLVQGHTMTVTTDMHITSKFELLKN
jgi:hypothetical protein